MPLSPDEAKEEYKQYLKDVQIRKSVKKEEVVNEAIEHIDWKLRTESSDYIEHNLSFFKTVNNPYLEPEDIARIAEKIAQQYRDKGWYVLVKRYISSMYPTIIVSRKKKKESLFSRFLRAIKK